MYVVHLHSICVQFFLYSSAYFCLFLFLFFLWTTLQQKEKITIASHPNGILSNFSSLFFCLIPYITPLSLVSCVSYLFSTFTFPTLLFYFSFSFSLSFVNFRRVLCALLNIREFLFHQFDGLEFVVM